jgi:hypothetical protein
MDVNGRALRVGRQAVPENMPPNSPAPEVHFHLGDTLHAQYNRHRRARPFGERLGRRNGDTCVPVWLRRTA